MTLRRELLTAAADLVDGERDKQYGKPEDSYRVIADLWTVFLKERQKNSVSLLLNPQDVAKMMILLKVARSMASSNEDNWLDIAGYAACGYEVEFQPAVTITTTATSYVYGEGKNH